MLNLKFLFVEPGIICSVWIHTVLYRIILYKNKMMPYYTFFFNKKKSLSENLGMDPLDPDPQHWSFV